MKQYKLAWVLGCIIGILSCESDKGQIVGFWKKEETQSIWFHFKKNGEFDFGNNKEIVSSGEWEIDEDHQLLTIKSDKSGVKYKYKFRKEILELTPIGGDKSLNFIK